MSTKVAITLSAVVDCEHDNAAPPVPQHTEASSELLQNEPKTSNEELLTGQIQTQRQNEVAYNYCTNGLMFVIHVQ